MIFFQTVCDGLWKRCEFANIIGLFPCPIVSRARGSVSYLEPVLAVIEEDITLFQETMTQWHKERKSLYTEELSEHEKMYRARRLLRQLHNMTFVARCTEELCSGLIDEDTIWEHVSPLFSLVQIRPNRPDEAIIACTEKLRRSIGGCGKLDCLVRSNNERSCVWNCRTRQNLAPVIYTDYNSGQI